ncbi:hypothetical protein OJ998_06355 [Solirubrobacter taibaiensis]|nr:hypothetical protein [Solirubrobacter taibaiensis]
MSSLTPDVALAYVRELSADVRAGIVLDSRGNTLAGAPGLHAAATRLLAARPHARELHGVGENGSQVFVIRDDERAIVVVTGRHALPRVIRRDMRTVLSGNAGDSGQEVPFERLDSGLVNPVATAAADAFRP